MSDASQTSNYGNSIVIDHGEGYTSRYSHMRDIPSQKKGDKIKQGEKIGVVGNTGKSTGHHLDVEIRKNNESLDVLQMLGGLP